MNEVNREYISDRSEEEIDPDIAQPNRKQPPHEPRLTFRSSGAGQSRGLGGYHFRHIL